MDLQKLMRKKLLIIVLVIQTAGYPIIKHGRDDMRNTCNSLDASGTGQWNIDRIDQREEIHHMNEKQKYMMGTHDDGYGVDVYVVDTGVDRDHSELRGGTREGYVIPGLAEGDTDGHGTLLAGIVASSTWGVAKGGMVVPVKVQNQPGQASESDIILGLDWIKSDHAAKPADTKSVVLLPFSLPKSQTLDDAVKGLPSERMTVVAAAGDDGQDACGFSPANIATVFTVAATDRNDKAANDNNYGSCVDIFAPGVEVRSITPGGSDAMTTGTAMAAALVSGIFARHMSDTLFIPPYSYEDWVISGATKGAIQVNTAQESTPNRLAFIGCTEPGSGGPDPDGSGHNIPLMELYAFLIIFGSFWNIFPNW